MQKAAALIYGEHDFSAFAATDPERLARVAARLDNPLDAPSNIRTMVTSEWMEDLPNNLLLYRIRGNGFLHHMVRNLVGTFLEVGRGNKDEAAMTAILQSRCALIGWFHRPGPRPIPDKRGLPHQPARLKRVSPPISAVTTMP